MLGPNEYSTAVMLGECVRNAKSHKKKWPHIEKAY